MMAQSYEPLPALNDRQFVEWQQLIEARTGIDFSLHRSILQSGLTRRMRHLDDIAYDAYFDQVQRQPEGRAEWQALIACIAVKETSFFRQPAAFELVQSYLQKRVLKATSIDLWSVGCATGEEAFGLAMAANNAIEGQRAQCCFGVLGSDLCAEALQQARAGRFPVKRLERIPEVLCQRYFVADDSDGFVQAVASLRERICFLQANLLEIERLPALPMDVIFCQNVLVYFRRWRTKRVLDALVERLKPGGLLVLGPGEAAQWQHPALLRTTYTGVSAWLRRNENVAAPQ